MNLCIVTSSFPSHPDDIVQAPFLIDFIEGLKKRKHRVSVFTQDRKEIKKEFLEGVKVKWFPWARRQKPLVGLNPINPFDLFCVLSLLKNGRKALIPFLKENRVDACLGLWVLPGGYFANCAYRSTGIPYSLWALGSDIYRYGKNPFLYPLMRRIIQEAFSVYADGFDLARRVEERFDRKCEFLATARKSLSEFNKPDKPNTSDQPYHFLFVGRLEKVKGIDLLIHALSMLQEEHLVFHLTVVGKGEMEKWARNFTKQKGLEHWVTFIGLISDETLASLYRSSDCVVIPSRSESIPLVFSEALSFNKQLIVTDVGDMGMLGRTYGTAEVVPSENPAALKEAMKRKIMSRKAPEMDEKRKELLKLFEIESSVERFLADY